MNTKEYMKLEIDIQILHWHCYQMLFSFAAFENSKTVTIKHFYKAICNTKNVYEDTKIKEIEAFKIIFADLIKEENIDLDNIN